jgi:beta-glucosidase
MSDKQKQSFFPKNFFWGASTASHQVEGGTLNQWSVWELAHATELAKQAKKRYGHLPNWEDIKQQAQKPENYVSGQAVDHYNRYKEDFDIAAGLNLNAFRFGIEWARIEPEEGQWDEQAIAHYRQYIKELKARGMEPFLNLWHWTMPTWFDEKGGLTKRSNLRYFERFVRKVAEEYAAELNYVITINEPNTYAANSYVNGKWPPQHKNILEGAMVYFNLVAAHKRAYKILKAAKKSLQVGAAPQMGNIQAKRPHNLLDEFSTKIMRYIWNWWLPAQIRRHQDFVGVNYYFTDYFTGLLKRENPSVPLNDLGWYAEPEGLYPLLLRVWVRFKKPIIITENGIADANDQYRRWWLEETVIAMERAISEGVDLRGYFHWSLLDNFEWSDGWWPKFGLVEVDREHDMKRTIRPSAQWLADKISQLKSI